jgi:hypothetical protein
MTTLDQADQHRLDTAAALLEEVGRRGELTVSTRCLLAASLLAEAGAATHALPVANPATAAAIQQALLQLSALSRPTADDERILVATEHALAALAATR